MKYALEQGIINISDVQEKIEMNKKNEIIKNHPYRIWQSEKDKYWRTYVYDDSKPKGYRLIKKKEEKELYELIINESNKNSPSKMIPTFKNCFFSMLESKKEIVSINTVDKYEFDYKRFFEGTWIEECAIYDITAEKLNVFLIKRIKELNLRKKAMKSMYTYITSTFLSAMMNGKIEKNPCMYLQKPQFYTQYCHVPICETSDRIVNNEQMKLLREQFEDDHKRKPDYIPTYAVEFAALTGMRVGEIAALTWDSINDNILIINKEEIYDRKNNKYYVVDYTKNKKPRVIPLTSEMKKLLEKVEKIEKSIGCYGKYIFMDKNGKINKRKIGECARNKSLQCGIDIKSIHSFRRTINSSLKCAGVSSVVAASLIGNSERVNDIYYTYDMSDMEYKRKMLEIVNKKMIHN